MLFELQDRSKILDSAVDGFLRGNSFLNEFIPYSNYSIPKVNLHTPKEQLEFLLMVDAFRVEDLSLYLDLYPTQAEVLKAYQKANLSYQEHLKQYESLYGAVDLYNTISKEYSYVKGPWPWKGDSYVSL